mgnify:FL=1
MKQYNITGMSCAACANRIEKTVAHINGVESCSVSLLTNSMGVEGTASSESVIQAIENIGYGASEKGVDVWTGVQAYNFGKAYVDYIAKNGGKNTLPLAEAYSKDVVAPSLGNTTAEEYYHITLDSLLFNKGKLYRNGGNIFYAKEVRWNMKIVHLFNW